MFVAGIPGQNCRTYGHAVHSTTVGDTVHYAYVTDPPTQDPEMKDTQVCATECPQADGMVYNSISGEVRIDLVFVKFTVEWLTSDGRTIRFRATNAPAPHTSRSIAERHSPTV